MTKITNSHPTLSSDNPSPSPVLVIVMGVSGSGKTKLAKLLAERLDYHYVEADDFHSDEAIARMQSGVPLDDDIRADWIARLKRYLQSQSHKNINCTLAFSGLKARHRAQIKQSGFHTLTLFLNGDKNLIKTRMDNRDKHFMPSSLLDSQFDALENPSDEPTTIELNIAATIDELLLQAIEFIETNIIR